MLFGRVEVYCCGDGDKGDGNDRAGINMIRNGGINLE